jgi:endothelin-converting enzyme
LEAPIPEGLDKWDDSTLKTIQALYKECLNESKLDEVGQKPLLDQIRVVRGLYNGSTSIEPHLVVQEAGTTATSNFVSKGLTAALAYLHSRGVKIPFECS